MKTQKKLKNLEIMQQMQSISVFPDVTKIADFRWESAVVSRTQGVRHLIYVFFGSSLEKVQLCQVSSM